MLNILNKKFFFNLFIIFLIFISDRLSKIYVIYLSEKNFDNNLYTSKFLNINLIWNEGIAFGLFSFDKSLFYNFLSFLIGIVIIIIIFILKNSEGLKRYFFLMSLGGALGNFYDRLFYNAVPDFIDFNVGNIHWFIFNVSDIFIPLGVILMIVLEVFSNKRETTNEKI